ncbi:hypothetical protein LCGC14_0470740 [marine sediment metagenome]|uniref:Uncharacterized protein n=1 Tax=marine sediment metagenome TaxID=412755 RepID=A0A0F9SCE5_9ZZZZ
MAAIYLRHSKHGLKVACSSLEADADKLNGWVEYDPNVPIQEPEKLGEPDFLKPDPVPDPIPEPVPDPVPDTGPKVAPRPKVKSKAKAK